MTDGRQVLLAYIEALNAGDWEAAASVLAADYVEDWPQTAERVHGVENLHAILEHYPGNLRTGAIDGKTKTVTGAEDRYILSPSMTLVRVDGGGEMFTLTYTARYPEGDTWYVVMIARVTDGKIRRAHTYFAPVMPAPGWRRDWVESTGH